jgi:hypothetical protein
VGDVVEYWITAADMAQNAQRTRLPESGSFRVEVVEALEEDFEPGPVGWSHEPVVVAQADPWHLTTIRNHTPGGAQAWLCGFDEGSYPRGAAAALLTEWYAIGSGARAEVWSWMEAVATAAGARDGGRVEMQLEGEESWSILEPLTGYSHRVDDSVASNVLGSGTPCFSGQDGDWRRLEFDLGNWSGRRLRLRFLFGSAAGETSPHVVGWSIDDFRLLPGTADPTDTSTPAPATRVLIQVGPNPFNPRVTFKLQVPENAGHVRLDIVDTRGRLRRRLLDAIVPAGPLRVDWDASGASGVVSASGVYYYRLWSSLGLERGKLVLLR